MKQLLRENALESWATAISSCDKIMNGKVTLSNQKYFVSSLQNAIELFSKQNMLNKCDHRVIEFTKIDASGEPLKSYLLTNDLNDYIKNSINNVKYKSIDFSKIIDLFQEIFKEYFVQHNNSNSVKNALNQLKQLRNAETHFYIDSECFLKESVFVSLYNLMIDFYDILEYYQLLPYFGKGKGKYSRFAFDRNRISVISYRDQLRQSLFVKELKKNIEGKTYPTSGGKESYSIAKDILNYSEVYNKGDFDEIWTYIEVLLRYDMIIIKDDIEYENVKGQDIPPIDYRTYSIKI